MRGFGPMRLATPARLARACGGVRLPRCGRLAREERHLWRDVGRGDTQHGARERRPGYGRAGRLGGDPRECRLAEALQATIVARQTYPTWEQAWDALMPTYGHYDRRHSFNNAVIVLLGLLYGEMDFAKTIAITVMSGMDTDCNGATSARSWVRCWGPAACPSGGLRRSTTGWCRGSWATMIAASPTWPEGRWL